MKKTLAILTLAMLALTACDSSTTAAASAATAQVADAYAASASSAKGFVAGNATAARTIYVYYDAQCPHCGHLWQEMKALDANLKVVWIPVGLLNPASISQGAAILNSAEPAKTMDQHEDLLAQGTHGMAAPFPTDEKKAVIDGNTKLLMSLGAESVPYVVAKDVKTGAVIKFAGALPTQTLREQLGI